jgi:HEAT repeat protein
MLQGMSRVPAPPRLTLASSLIEALREGDEARARAQVTQLGAHKARPLLEAMLEDADAAVRQAAAFGLGELGGAASTKRLEHQLALEQARRSRDGAAVVEAITQALHPGGERTGGPHTQAGAAGRHGQARAR